MANQSALQVDKIIITRQNPEALEPLPPSELEYGELAVDQAGKLYTADKDNNVVVAGGGEEQEWSEIDNQTAAEPPNPRQADQLEGYDVQAIVEKAVEAATLIDDLTPPEPETPRDADTLNGLSSEQIIGNNGISLYIHSKTGTVHNFNGSGINGRAKMTANVEAGDTFTVNGSPVTAYMGTESAVDSMAGNEWNGKWISFIVEDGTLNFKGGGGKVTVTGLSANKILEDTIVTIKQGTKTVASVKGTIPFKTAATYTPTTTNQTIAAGQYLSGTQTIKGDAKLKAENIKNGVSIFGVSGSYGKQFSSSNIAWLSRDTNSASGTYTITESGTYIPVVIAYLQSGNTFSYSVNGANTKTYAVNDNSPYCVKFGPVSSSNGITTYGNSAVFPSVNLNSGDKVSVSVTTQFSDRNIAFVFLKV